MKCQNSKINQCNQNISKKTKRQWLKRVKKKSSPILFTLNSEKWINDNLKIWTVWNDIVQENLFKLISFLIKYQKIKDKSLLANWLKTDTKEMTNESEK